MFGVTPRMEPVERDEAVKNDASISIEIVVLYFISLEQIKIIKPIEEIEKKKRLLICRLLMGLFYQWIQFLCHKGCTLEITNLVKLSGVYFFHCLNQIKRVIHFYVH